MNEFYSMSLEDLHFEFIEHGKLEQELLDRHIPIDEQEYMTYAQLNQILSAQEPEFIDIENLMFSAVFRALKL